MCIYIILSYIYTYDIVYIMCIECVCNVFLQIWSLSLEMDEMDADQHPFGAAMNVSLEAARLKMAGQPVRRPRDSMDGYPSPHRRITLCVYRIGWSTVFFGEAYIDSYWTIVGFLAVLDTGEVVIFVLRAPSDSPHGCRVSGRPLCQCSWILSSGRPFGCATQVGAGRAVQLCQPTSGAILLGSKLHQWSHLTGLLGRWCPCRMPLLWRRTLYWSPLPTREY